MQHARKKSELRSKHYCECCCLFFFSRPFLRLHLCPTFSFREANRHRRTPVEPARCLWQEHRRVRQPPFVVLLIDREAPRKSLSESDSRLLPGTSRRVALPELPTGVKGEHRTSVHHGRRSDFPGRWSVAPRREARSDGGTQTGWVTLKTSEAKVGGGSNRCLFSSRKYVDLRSCYRWSSPQASPRKELDIQKPS